MNDRMTDASSKVLQRARELTRATRSALAYRRNSCDIGLPLFALLLVPLIFVIGLPKSRGPDAGKVPEAERQLIVVGYPIFMVLAIGGQLWFARPFFDAARG